MKSTRKRPARTRANPAHAFRPRVQRLEDRCTPTLAVVQQGNGLVSTGDDGDDDGTVADHGREGVTIFEGRQELDTFSGVEQIVIDSNGGDDFVTFWRTTSDTPVTRVDVNLGSAAEERAYVFTARPGPNGPDYSVTNGINRTGDRAFFVDETGVIRIDGAGQIGFKTGAGEVSGLDTLIATLDSPRISVSVLMNLGTANDRVDFSVVNAAAPVEIHASMGAGNDALDVHITGEMSAAVSVETDLGEGDDRLQFDNEGLIPRLPPPPDPPPTLLVNALGGLGNDVVIIIPCVVPGLDCRITADLGEGDDVFDATIELPPPDPDHPPPEPEFH